MASPVKTRAIVITSIRYGESDLIVTFLTDCHGIVKGIAKSALKSRKRFAGCFEPFTLLELTYRDKGTGGLAGIDAAEISDAHYGIRENLDRIEAGARMLELVSAVEAGGQECGHVFSLLDKTLGLIEKSKDPAPLCGIFLVKYIGISGYKIPYESCHKCGKPLAGNGAYYPGGYGLFCAGCKGLDDPPRLSPGCIAFIKGAEEIDLARMGRLKLSKPAEAELFGFLKRYVSGVIGKSLKTLENIP